MRRILLVMAVVLVMAAVAAPSALARPQHVWCYTITGDGGATERTCNDASGLFLSKKECEQARANDPAVSEKCRHR